MLNKLADKLDVTGSVAFVDGDNLICITWSESGDEDGYMIDVYNVWEVTENNTPVDGGLCTGSALDAVAFFTSDEK